MDYLLSDRLTLHLTRSREVERREKREDGKTTDFSLSYSPSLLSPLPSPSLSVLYRDDIEIGDETKTEGRKRKNEDDIHALFFIRIIMDVRIERKTEKECTNSLQRSDHSIPYLNARKNHPLMILHFPLSNRRMKDNIR